MVDSTKKKNVDSVTKRLAKKKKKVTSEDVPGNGLAKKAAKAIEKRRERRKKLLGY